MAVRALYCHGGGRPNETDVNPRKDLARKMIMLVRQINANFPGTGVFPVAPQLVTCYTCHRGDPHPAQSTLRASRNSPMRESGPCTGVFGGRILKLTAGV